MFTSKTGDNPNRHMPSELDEKIKDLCAKAIQAEGEELNTVLAELREALREQSARTD